MRVSKVRDKVIPLNRTPFVDGGSCSRCRPRRSNSRLRSAAKRSFSSRSNRASYSSSVSFGSPAGSIFPDREGESSGSFRSLFFLCLCFRLCRLPESSSAASAGERDRRRLLCRLRVRSSSASSSDSLALTDGSFAKDNTPNKRVVDKRLSLRPQKNKRCTNVGVRPSCEARARRN